MRIIYFLVLLFALSACNSDQKGPTNTQEQPKEENRKHYGKKITAADALTLNNLIEKITTGEGATDLDLGEGHIVKAIPAKVEGNVSAVCKMAGCWLDIESEGKTMTILTNDDFFVKSDIIGKTVVIEGHAYEAIRSVAELKSEAKEAGLSVEEIEQITSPISDYKLLAKGLVIK